MGKDSMTKSISNCSNRSDKNKFTYCVKLFQTNGIKRRATKKAQVFTFFAFWSILIVNNLSKWSMSGTPWIEITACCDRSVVSGFSGCGAYVTTSSTETCFPKLICKQKKITQAAHRIISRNSCH